MSAAAIARLERKAAKRLELARMVHTRDVDAIHAFGYALALLSDKALSELLERAKAGELR